MVSSGMSVPKSLLILAASKGMRLQVLFSGYRSMMPPTTSPAPSSSISWQALFTASSAVLGSSPFSYFPDASVRSPTFLADRRMLVPLKQADSNTMVCTLSVIFEFSPPMIPAMPTSFSPSFIMRMVESSFLSWPSSVWNTSPSLAHFTMISWPASWS